MSDRRVVSSGSIVGLLSRRGEDVCGKVVEMLKLLERRGPDSAGLNFNSRTVVQDNAAKLSLPDAGAPLATGRNWLRVSEVEAERQDMFGSYQYFTVTSEGEIYGFDGGEVEGVSLSEAVSRGFKSLFRGDAVKAVRSFMQTSYGEYVFAVASASNGGEVILARDPVGARTLYSGASEAFIGFASERKALWGVGIKDVQTLPPGCIGVMSKNGVEVRKVLTLKDDPYQITEMDEAVERISEKLVKACRLRVRNMKEVGVLFSGGLDSSLLAHVLTGLNLNVKLYTAGIKGSPGLQAADSAATALGLNLRVKEFSPDEIEHCIGEVVYAIERRGVLDVGVGIPIYLSSKLARQDGLKVVFSGQGCDELFGGYFRYLRVLSHGGYVELQRTLLHDVSNMASVNLERDDAAVMANSVELRSPFADVKLVDEALKISPRLKISGSQDGLRKLVLRKVARRMGMPETVTGRVKKAVQYSSGADKALRIISRRRSENLKLYIEKIFVKEFSRLGESRG